MRALILTEFSSHDMLPLALADEQIIAGPHWPDTQTIDGSWRTLRTPVGEYDLAEMLAKIPAEQKPDFIVCLLGTERRHVPGNVASFSGMKVLLVADTPDFGGGPRGVVPSAIAESYDHVGFLSDPNIPIALQPDAAA